LLQNKGPSSLDKLIWFVQMNWHLFGREVPVPDVFEGESGTGKRSFFIKLATFITIETGSIL